MAVDRFFEGIGSALQAVLTSIEAVYLAPAEFRGFA